MGIKKVTLSVIMLTTFASSVALAESAPASNVVYQDAIKKNVEKFVKSAYDPFYTINSTKLSTSDMAIKDNVLTARVNISLTKTLKAKTVEDIPYVKGMKGQQKVLKLSDAAAAADAEEVIKEKMEDLTQYIGTSQDQNDQFRITANIVNGALDINNAKLEFLNDVDWVPADVFKPKTETDMIKNGEADLKQAVTVNKNFSVKKNAKAAASAQRLATFTYDRIAARDYANKWTSEVTSDPYYDISKYNPAYSNFSDPDSVDCANYVSQALFAGGIPTDSTWKKYTIAWVNTGRNNSGGLTPYMVTNKGYFYKTTQMGVSAGGFISAKNYSHVMFVVANDGVTMQFSAHTNDRLKASFSGMPDSTYEYFYINSAYLP